MIPPQRETPIIPIASFAARRAARAHAAVPELLQAHITVIPMPPLLTDIGPVASPSGAVMIAGPGADLDDTHRVQPIWTPSQARLVAERLLAAARVAECPSCTRRLRDSVIEVPVPVCAACESGATGE